MALWAASTDELQRATITLLLASWGGEGMGDERY